jgi:phytoene dehydrogenase-like protein
VAFVTRPVPDAVVVGAGHNGLVAAAVLADAGWDVEVVEAAEEPGGGLRSFSLEPGFVSDHCASFFPFGAASPVFRALGLDIPWRHGPVVLAHPGLDGSCPVLERGALSWSNRLVEGCGLHTDAGRLTARAVGVALVEAGRRYGFPCVSGGAGTLTGLLVERARHAILRLGERVDALPRARRAVILACDVWEAGRLLDRPAHVRPDPETLKIDWTLDGPVPWTLERPRRSPVVHLGERGRFAIVGQYSMADGSRMPEGKEVAWAYTHDAIDLEALLEEHAPGFRALIRERRVERMPPGRVNGGTMGWRNLRRPGPRLAPGVYLGSMSACPGGGVHGVPGWIAAQAALRSVRSRRLRTPESFTISST